MPVASGSIAYLGAARFQGFWNATTNHATGSGLAEAASGSFVALFASGTAPTRGYAHGGITASSGDYWQVSGSGAHNLSGVASWRVNDWVIYSGSAGSSGTWKKLAFEDTIASIILGDLSSSSFHMGVENDKHILFDSGSVHSGSSKFVFDYVNNRVGIGTSTPSSQLEIEGASGDLIFEIDNNAANSANFQIQNGAGNARVDLVMNDGTANTTITMKGQKVGIGDTTPSYTLDVGGNFRSTGNALFDANVNLGNANTDVTTVASRLTASSGLMVPDDKKLRFGDASEAHIKYDETASNYLTISGSSAGLVLSGSKLVLDLTTVTSGSGIGQGSMLGVNAVGQVMITSSGAKINDAATSRLVTVASNINELDAEASLTYDGSTFIIDDDSRLNDDHKFYFGTNNDSYISYNDSQNFMIISGSAAGLALSGSVVVLDTNTVQLTGSLLADIVVNRTTAANSQVVPEGHAARINGPYTVPAGMTLTINGRAEISDV